MLTFHLVENLLTAAPDDAMAQVVNIRTYTDEEIAELMLKRGSLLTKADILAVLEVYREVVCDLVSDGSGINTQLFNITASISGVFNGIADNYDPARHKIHANIHTGVALRDAVKKIKPEKVQVADPIPNIVEVKDVLSGSVNEILTPGGVLQLRGSRLKFFEDKENNGIFLIPEYGGVPGGEIKITVIAENKPGRLIAMLPNYLPAGHYHLEVRTTYLSGGSHESKQVKIGRFAKMLIV